MSSTDKEKKLKSHDRFQPTNGKRSALTAESGEIDREFLHSNTLNFNQLVNALSIDIETICCVDTQTDDFLEFTAHTSDSRSYTELSGHSFFEEYPARLLPNVCEKDREKLSLAFQKETLLEHLRQHKVFTAAYCVNAGDSPAWYRMKAVYAGINDNEHVIIGFSNITHQITKEEKRQIPSSIDAVPFTHLAGALARDYFSIYVVDTQTDEFHEQISDSRCKTPGIRSHGNNFFDFIRKNAEKTVYPEDLSHFLSAFTKSNILNTINSQGTFTITYRLLIENRPSYVSMKISGLDESGPDKIVVGINNIQAGMDDHHEMLPFTSISNALAGDYIRVYYLNIETDSYIEFAPRKGHDTLEVEKNGTSFFDEFRRTTRSLIHPDDEAKFLSEFTREAFYEHLAAHQTYTMTYRQYLDNHWKYVQLKAVGTGEPYETHVVIGISDIDQQIRREEQHNEAIRLASLDILTGVKTRHVYSEDEKQLNKMIRNGSVKPFAIVSCDMNDLKKINDTYGHAEGDEHIKQAARTISHVYRNSSVYRIGGDEFLVILQNEDYENRDHLYKMIMALNNSLPVGRKIVIAAGMSLFDPEKDTSVSEVAKRADAAMYENKKKLKI